MKRFIASGVTFEMKDTLKNIRPAVSWQRWKFDPKTKEWIITLQTAQVTKKFTKELNLFCEENQVILNSNEWDGTNKGNNYEHR